MFIRTVCFDFDGVIHKYKQKWQGVDVIPDGPVVDHEYKGGMNSIEWLQQYIDYTIDGVQAFDVCIYSSRSKERKGIDAMKKWLLDNGMTQEYLYRIRFPAQKPAVFMTIDDRVMCFQGLFIHPEEVLAFKPWNKKEKTEKTKYRVYSEDEYVLPDKGTPCVSLAMMLSQLETQKAVRIVEIDDDGLPSQCCFFSENWDMYEREDIHYLRKMWRETDA